MLFAILLFYLGEEQDERQEIKCKDEQEHLWEREIKGLLLDSMAG